MEADGEINSLMEEFVRLLNMEQKIKKEVKVWTSGCFEDLRSFEVFRFRASIHSRVAHSS